MLTLRELLGHLGIKTFLEIEAENMNTVDEDPCVVSGFPDSLLQFLNERTLNAEIDCVYAAADKHMKISVVLD